MLNEMVENAVLRTCDFFDILRCLLLNQWYCVWTNKAILKNLKPNAYSLLFNLQAWG